MNMGFRSIETEYVNAIKGASIKYVRVRTEGGRGVCPKADIVLEISKVGCMILWTRIPKFLRTCLMEAP